MYEKLYSALIASEADLSICNFRYVYENTSKPLTLDKNDNLPIKDEKLTGIEVIEKNFGI